MKQSIQQLLDKCPILSPRTRRRRAMSRALAALPDFHADETFETEYNGFTLQIDNTREELAFVDQQLEITRFRFDELVAVYNIEGDGASYDAKVSSSVQYTQAALFLETTRPGKERIGYIYFNAWHSVNPLIRLCTRDYTSLLKARRDVMPAYEYLQDIIQMVHELGVKE